MRKIITILIALLFMLSVVGCSGPAAPAAPAASATPAAPAVPVAPEEEANPKLGIVIHTSNIPSFNVMLDGAKETAESLGYEVVIADYQDDEIQAVSCVENLCTVGCDVILINPMDSKSIVPAIEVANRAGVPVVMFDIDAEGGERAAHVTDDNEMYGRYGAEWLAWKLNGEGAIAVMEYPQMDIVAMRGDAFYKVMESFPDIEIVAVGNGINRDDTLPQMESFLQAHPEIKGAWGCNGGAAFGIYYACQAAGRDDIVVCGGDGEDEGIELIRSGSKYGYDSAHLGWLLGSLAAETCDKIVRGEEVEYRTIQPVFPISLENIDQWPGIEADEMPDESIMKPAWYSDPSWIELCEKVGYTAWQD